MFIVLQNGLYLDNVSISNIHAKNIYIIWNNKLNISAQELKISTTSKKTKQYSSFEDMSRYLKVLSQTTNWFHSIVITRLHVNNTSGSFKYTNDTQGFLTLHSPTFSLHSNIYFKSHLLRIDIREFKDKKREIRSKGSVIFDTDTKKIYTKINFNIHNDANLTLYAVADSKRLIYKVLSNKNIDDISHLIQMAQLPKEVIYWAYTAIKMQYLTIQSFKGFIDYNDLSNAYKNIYIKAFAKKLNYAYNPKLDAVHTQQTNLEFKNGVLYIRPQQAYSYGMNLGKSWLKIDFSKKEELLTLHLLFDGMLNKDMLHVLDTYDIKLPFLQRKGKVATKLTIKVNLRTIDVDAKGDFYTKVANFDYLGLNIDIYNTHIHLDNYDVLIDKMNAKYKNIAQADVHVNFNAKKSIGIINLDFNKIKTADVSLVADKSAPLHIAYNIHPKQDTIDIQKSHWKYKNQRISFDKLLVKFNLNTLEAKIPVTFFRVAKTANGYVSGLIHLKTFKMNIDVDVLKLQYGGIELSQTVTPLKIKYDKYLSISSASDIYFNVNGSAYKAKDFYINFEKKSVYLKHTFLQIGQYIYTKIYANYDFASKKAHISLSDFILKNPETGEILYKNNKILLGGHIDGKNITIDSKELDATFVSNSQQWKLTLNSIATVAKKSQFLQQYKLNKGEISFYKKNDALYTQLSANILYPYHLLVNQNKQISKYSITGEITKEHKISLTINKHIHIKIDKDIKIKVHDSGLNIDAIIDFTKQLTQTKTSKNELKLSVDAINSYLYLGNKRYVLSDAIHLQYYNDILTAQLTHKQGHAGFKLQNNTFHLYGKNFNDKFMEKLFVLSRFSGGSLDFSMDGTLDDYKGVFYVYDTTMIDYKLLNNVLAFVNTIPSLVTFSLPGYSKKGLHVNNAYVKFHAQKGVFDISDIYLESKEMTILGKGSADINKNTINLTLNLKTDLGSNLSKVPLVGYIIFDGKNISTTLKVTGKLNDPTINTMLAKDIVVAPLNIIKRTLTLPYELIKKLY